MIFKVVILYKITRGSIWRDKRRESTAEPWGTLMLRGPGEEEEPAKQV